MVFNHGIHGIYGRIVSVVLLFGFGVAAEPSISVSARQRYPWNGLVDLSFTITGASGTKYDTSFTAKDMVGGTNITMKTIRKADGTAAAEKEQLLPGSYNWVWDAESDLPDGFECERMTVTGTAESRDVHEKVQLWEGGPYWARTNIGAEEPWERGYYFWWGDTVGYKRENDKWVASDGSNSDFLFSSFVEPTTYDKSYSTLQSANWITAGGVLAPEYDAAQKHWGGNWRMPTKRELTDLNNKCDWTWTTMNGVYGYAVRGRGEYVTNSIFLPCAGDGYRDSLESSGSTGCYWSSVPESDIDYYYSWTLYFYSGCHGTDYYYRRYYGLSVRPVQDAK